MECFGFRSTNTTNIFQSTLQRRIKTKICTHHDHEVWNLLSECLWLLDLDSLSCKQSKSKNKRFNFLTKIFPQTSTEGNWRRENPLFVCIVYNYNRPTAQLAWLQPKPQPAVYLIHCAAVQSFFFFFFYERAPTPPRSSNSAAFHFHLPFLPSLPLECSRTPTW